MLPEVNTVAERLDKLERQNRQMKICGGLVILPLAAVFLMGQSASNRKIEASEFVLKDQQGTVRAKLFMEHDGASLSFYDSGSVRRINLTQPNPNVAGLFLYNDPAEKYGGAEMMLTPDGSTLMLTSTKHQNVAAISTDAHGPALDIPDADGYTATIGSSDSVIRSTGEKRKTSAASISLMGGDKSVMWSAP